MVWCLQRGGGDVRAEVVVRESMACALSRPSAGAAACWCLAGTSRTLVEPVWVRTQDLLAKVVLRPFFAVPQSSELTPSRLIVRRSLHVPATRL